VLEDTSEPEDIYEQENIIEPKSKVTNLTNKDKKPLVENNID
jgi:hypothetical protein